MQSIYHKPRSLYVSCCSPNPHNPSNLLQKVSCPPPHRSDASCTRVRPWLTHDEGVVGRAAQTRSHRSASGDEFSQPPRSCFLRQTGIRHARRSTRSRRRPLPGLEVVIVIVMWCSVLKRVLMCVQVVIRLLLYQVA